MIGQLQNDQSYDKRSIETAQHDKPRSSQCDIELVKSSTHSRFTWTWICFATWNLKLVPDS